MPREPRAWQLLLPMPAPCIARSAVPREEIERRLEELRPTIERTTESLRRYKRRRSARVDVRSLVLDAAWRVAASWRADGGAAMATLLIGWARRHFAGIVARQKRPAAMATGKPRPSRGSSEHISKIEIDRRDSRTSERCPVADDLLRAIRRQVHAADLPALEVLLRSETMTEAAEELGCGKERVRQRRVRMAERCLGLLSQGDEDEREMWRRRLGLAGKRARMRRASGG